ncbi:MAG: hypothetical protein Q6J74_06575, partial [Gloeomargarita sp. DG02_1_bins_92]
MAFKTLAFCERAGKTGKRRIFVETLDVAPRPGLRLFLPSGNSTTIQQCPLTTVAGAYHPPKTLACQRLMPFVAVGQSLTQHRAINLGVPP